MIDSSSMKLKDLPPLHVCNTLTNVIVQLQKLKLRKMLQVPVSLFDGRWKYKYLIKGQNGFLTEETFSITYSIDSHSI
jgi:hypothetical protein